MLSKIVPFLKLAAALDGAVAAVAAGVAAAFPTANTTCLAVIGVCGTVGTILGGVSKLTAPAVPS